ncbi:MAG TPA: carboxylesterase family protein [Paludibacteraceae bacterium]|nr:carboxylesterase family protein [Paludibacteraceae bacterium]
MKISNLLVILGLLFCFSFVQAKSIQKITRTYAVKDSLELKMDIYTVDSTSSSLQPCLVFVFGGGFKEGKRDEPTYQPYFDYFTKKGFMVVSIDYRLGMKDQRSPGVFNTKPLQNAISLAVLDLYSATKFLIEKADSLKIDKNKIIISGSSAGAITVLQAEYELKNHHAITSELPHDFRFAGVISFAGGIFSTKGMPSYAESPAPTLFFHGSADKLVPYKETRLFNKGMFGSRSLTNKFHKKKYSYLFYSMEGLGHEVASFPMKEFLPEIEQFIQNFVFEQKPWMVEVYFTDKERKTEKSVTPADYYK